MTVVESFTNLVHRPSIRLDVYWNTTDAVDESAYVISASGTESMDDLGLPHPREATITLDNSTGRFTPGYTGSPLYAYTTHEGQRVRLYLGYDDDVVLVGTYVLREMTTNDDDRTVSWRIADTLEDFAELPVTLVPTANLTLSQAVTSLMSSAGVGTASYVKGTLAGTALYAYAKQTPLLQELWQVAVAEGGRVYLDEYGILQIQGRSARQAVLRAPVAELVASRVAYKSGASRGGEPTNRVVVTFEDRITATTPEPVFETEAPIEVPAAYQTYYQQLKPEYQPKQAPCPDGIVYNGHYYACGEEYQPVLPGGPLFDDYGNYYGNAPGNPTDAYETVVTFVPGQERITIRPQDQTRWKSNIPIDYSTVTFTVEAYPNAAGTGTPVVTEQLEENAPPIGGGTVLQYWFSGTGVSQSFGGYTWQVIPANTIYFYNTRSSLVYVTSLVMEALPSRKTGAYEIDAQDDEAISLNLGRVVERRLANSYMPGPSYARPRVQELLWMLTSKRTALQIPEIDGAPFLRTGEAFTFVDDVSRVPGTASLQVLENRWSYGENGYTCSLVTMPALDASSMNASAVNVPPVGTAVVTSERTGPFTWGPDGTALYWSQSSWG